MQGEGEGEGEGEDEGEVQGLGRLDLRLPQRSTPANGVAAQGMCCVQPASLL